MTLEELQLVRKAIRLAEANGADSENPHPSASKRWEKGCNALYDVMGQLADMACDHPEWRPWGNTLKKCVRCETIRAKESAHE